MPLTRRSLLRLSALQSLALLAACASPQANTPDSSDTTQARTSNLAASRTLRVVTWNIHHAEGADGRVDIDRIAARLKELDADVVFLQEVDRQTRRSGNVDQPTVLAHRLGMWSCFGDFMPYDGGQYGLCILSRWPLRDVGNVQLPAGQLEPRTVLVATLPLQPGLDIRLFNVHLDWLEDDQNRYAQGQALLGVVTADVAAMGKGPAIIAGDFNDGLGSRTLNLFQADFVQASNVANAAFDGPAVVTGTWPAEQPTQEIDFVFVHPGGRLTAAGSQSVEAKGASDHRPVVAEVVVR